MLGSCLVNPKDHDHGSNTAIDDDPMMRSMLVAVLTTAGHFVVEVPGAMEGLAVLKQSQPDLVITDIVMPADGIELITEMRSYYPQLPVIAMSGHSPHSPLYLKTARQLGAMKILGKPFAMDALLATVNGALNWVRTVGNAAGPNCRRKPGASAVAFVKPDLPAASTPP